MLWLREFGNDLLQALRALPGRSPRPDSIPAPEPVDHRGLTDRRQRLTPFLSLYTLRGQRRRHRRASDPGHRYFVDWSTGWHEILVLVTAGLIVFDLVSTLLIRTAVNDVGGVFTEENSLMAWVLRAGVGWFVSVKLGMALMAVPIFAICRFFPVALLGLTGLVVVHLGLTLQHFWCWVRIGLAALH
ncbi:MAG: hypothetical protein ABIF77_07010 [bacterium]